MRIGRAHVVRVALLALLGASVMSGAAAAAPTPAELREARELFTKVEEDERTGDFTAALEKLRRIGQIKMTPGVRFHTALAEERTGQLVQALADYALAEKQATDEKNKEVLGALREQMAALQARIPRIVLKVPPDVQGLEVSFDGKPVAPGMYDAEIRVDLRPYVVEAKAPGRRPFSRTVTPASREITTVDIVLEEAKAQKAAPPTPVPPPAAPPPPPKAEPRAALAPSNPPPAESGTKTTAILATVGAVVLAGGGVGALLISGAERDSNATECMTNRLRSANCDDLRSSPRVWGAVALTGFAAAAAVGTLAVVLWAQPTTAEKPHAARVKLGPGSIRVEGQF